MQTDWKTDMAMVDSMGDPLHNIMHSMGTNSVMGWNTVCYTSDWMWSHIICKYQATEMFGQIGLVIFCQHLRQILQFVI